MQKRQGSQGVVLICTLCGATVAHTIGDEFPWCKTKACRAKPERSWRFTLPGETTRWDRRFLRMLRIGIVDGPLEGQK